MLSDLGRETGEKQAFQASWTFVVVLVSGVFELEPTIKIFLIVFKNIADKGKGKFCCLNSKFRKQMGQDTGLLFGNMLKVCLSVPAPNPTVKSVLLIGRKLHKLNCIQLFRYSHTESFG